MRIRRPAFEVQTQAAKPYSSVHLLFDGVPSGIDFSAVRQCLLSQPGVTRVLDLHVWTMGISEVVLSAHWVRPEGYPEDEFFAVMTRALHERFDIDHVTVQVVRTPGFESGAVQ